MKIQQLLPLTALAVTLSAAVTPASAQTVNVTEANGMSGVYFTYTYTVMPSYNVQAETFFFSDPNVSTSAGGATASAFLFTNSIGANQSLPFTFYSTDAPGGTAAATVFGLTGFPPVVTAASQSGLPGPQAAPEPGSLASFSLLSACLGLGLVGRRRAPGK